MRARQQASPPLRARWPRWCRTRSTACAWPPAWATAGRARAPRRRTSCAQPARLASRAASRRAWLPQCRAPSSSSPSSKLRAHAWARPNITPALVQHPRTTSCLRHCRPWRCEGLTRTRMTLARCTACTCIRKPNGSCNPLGATPPAAASPPPTAVLRVEALRCAQRRPPPRLATPPRQQRSRGRKARRQWATAAHEATRASELADKHRRAQATPRSAHPGTIERFLGAANDKTRRHGERQPVRPRARRAAALHPGRLGCAALLQRPRRPRDRSTRREVAGLVRPEPGVHARQSCRRAHVESARK